MSHGKFIGLQDLIKKIKQIKQTRRLIDPEYRFYPIDLTPFIELKTIVFTFESITDDFIQSDGLTRYKNAIHNSKTLYSFMKSVDTKLKGKSNESIENIENISTAFNKGEFDVADQLASEKNHELFELIMDNQNRFKLSREFIQKNIRNYPIECIEICYFACPNEFDSLFPLNFESTEHSFKNNQHIRNFFSNKAVNSLENNIENDFYELLKSHIDKNELLNEFDDFIYKIDPFRINEIVIRNFNEIDIEISKYLLDFTSYSISDEDQAKFDQQLISLNENMINKLIQLNKIECIPQLISNQENLILQTYKKLTPEQVERFVNSFKDYQYIYELLASKEKDSIPILLNFCPENIKQELMLFNELPDSIKMNASLIDKDSITQFIYDDIKSTKTETILTKLKQNQLILINSNYILECLVDFCVDFDHYSKGALILFDSIDKTIFTELSSKRVLNDLLMITVDSLDSELKALNNVKKMIRFETTCKFDYKTSQLLHSFHDILNQSPFLYLNISYSCQNLVSVLEGFDLDQIAFNTPNEFIDQLLFTKSRIKSMLDLYQFNSAFDYLDQHPYAYSMNDFDLSPFLYNPIFDVDKLATIDQNNVNCVERIYLDLIDKSKNSVSNSMLISRCLDFCEKYSTKDSFLKLVVKINGVDCAISKFQDVASMGNNDMFHLFNSIVASSIEFNKLSQLQQEMQKNPNLKIYEKELSKFC